MNVHVVKKAGKIVIEPEVVPNPALPPEEQKAEKTLISRVKGFVSSAISRVRSVATRRRLAAIATLIIVMVLAMYARRWMAHYGAPPPMSDVEHDVRALVGGAIADEKKAADVLKSIAGTAKGDPTFDTWAQTHGIHADMCKYTPRLCEGGFFPRKLMPQVNLSKFGVDDVERAGATLKSELLRAGDMIPIQSELLSSKVAGISKAMNAGLIKGGGPILAARIDGKEYVIDGHHRWAATWASEKNELLPALVIEVPRSRDPIAAMQKVLQIAVTHPATTFQSLAGKPT